jgi:nucleoside-diphosphate-sugar epimerase
MKIALIGGSGFVGTRLTKRLLDAGHEVRILDKNESISYPKLRVEADVRDTESLVKKSFWHRARYKSCSRTSR